MSSSFVLEENLNIYSDCYYKILHCTEELYNNIERGDKQKSLASIKKLISLQTSFNAKLETWKNYAVKLNSNIRKSACIGGLDFLDSLIISLNFTFTLNNIANMQELKKQLTLIVGEYSGAVFDTKYLNSKKLAKKVCNYIQQNYKNNISVKQIAEQLNIQALYLSRQFKKDMKISVTQYIQFTRIEEAKRLIKLNKYSVKEIAAIVGFNNVQYFIRVFKSLELITPKKYLYRYEVK